MKVKDWMVKEVITVSPEDKIEDAFSLMKIYKIRHLPVIEKGKLVGFLTETEIRPYLYPDKLKLPVKEVMIKNPVVIHPEAFIDEAARIIYKHKIGGMPVVENDKLVGIITITDILEAFIELMGILRSSARIDIIPNNDNLDEVLETIKENGGKIISIGMDLSEKGEKVYLIRLEKGNLERIATELEMKGHRILSILS